MMKLLHSADWHLDAPMLGKTPDQADYLRQELLAIPKKVAQLCREQECQMLLLSGDLFDGTYTKESYLAVYQALKDLSIPVFISPGNHDFCCPGSVYLEESWPDNVHIFTSCAIKSTICPQLDCTVFGAGFESMDCPALLKDFSCQSDTKWRIAVLHGDPTVSASPYNPINTKQVRESGLHYLALGHIHKNGQFLSGDTLCGWPGCPMGKDFGETGIKGALAVTLDDTVSAEFIPLDTPRFFDERVDVGENTVAAVAGIIPAAPTRDFYRITLTGYSQKPDLNEVLSRFPHVPNLELRDQTLPEVDLWSNIEEDNLEGMFFRILHSGLETESQSLQRQIKAAARIARQILDGQEVSLP